MSALAWLANTLPEFGKTLRAGDYVTTGITTDEIYHANAGDSIIADLGEVGKARLQFD